MAAPHEYFDHAGRHIHHSGWEKQQGKSSVTKAGQSFGLVYVPDKTTRLTKEESSL